MESERLELDSVAVAVTALGGSARREEEGSEQNRAEGANTAEMGEHRWQR